MGTYKEIEGDLIQLALSGEFDVIAHGCNCFCTMGAGLAPQMAKAFGCNEFELEIKEYQYADFEELIETGNRGDINKLGRIDYQMIGIKDGKVYVAWDTNTQDIKNLIVVNAYTQYDLGRDLDYNALCLCLKKINYIFKGKHIGLPQIGCGIAGGTWGLVKMLIQEYLKDCDVTVVIYKK